MSLTLWRQSVKQNAHALIREGSIFSRWAGNNFRV